MSKRVVIPSSSGKPIEVTAGAAGFRVARGGQQIWFTPHEINSVSAAIDELRGLEAILVLTPSQYVAHMRRLEAEAETQPEFGKMFVHRIEGGIA